MKKIATAVVFGLLSLTAVNSFAAKATSEEKCKAKAEKNHIAAEKVDAYVTSCVAKHKKAAKMHASAKPAPAAKSAEPAAPAATH